MDSRIFIQNIGSINEKLKLGKGLVDPELLAEFDSKYTLLSGSIQDIRTEGRNLRIGVVGAVKAGKSTFLNSLLFDGKQILPKAPTPMTAALTKVCYSDAPSARIVFYSTQEWNKIKQNADEYRDKINEYLAEAQRQYNQQLTSAALSGNVYVTEPSPTFADIERKYRDDMPVELYSCYELVEMLDQKTQVSEYLERGEITITDKADFQKELNQFVGAEGIYTPIVKYTELSIDNELLRDIEVVDTPGLDDPIVSRSKKTQDFLLQCDVVFVLSYTGQFLTSEDMKLINKVLPSEGVSRAVLIASMFDSGILDYKKRNATFHDALLGTASTIQKSAYRQMEQIEKENPGSSIVKSLKDSDVLFASGLMYSIAKKLENREEMDEEEAHIFREFQRRFADFDPSAQKLYEYSGIEDIREKVIDKIKEKKDEIIHERINEFLVSQSSRFSKLLEDVNIDLRKNLKDINQYEYEALQEKAKKLGNNLDSVRKAINAKFSDAAIDAEKKMQVIIAEINDEMENHRIVRLGDKKVTEQQVRHTGFFGIFQEDVLITKNVKIVEVNEVIENIKRYCGGIHRIIIDSFGKLIDIEGLKREVKEKVQSAFDPADKDFEPEEIAITLNQMVGSLTIPEISLDVEKYTDMMLTRFPVTGAIEGESKIAELRTQQSIVLQKVFSDAKDELTKKSTMLADELNRCAGGFIDNVAEKLLNSIKRLQVLLADKEESIKKLEEYKESISECKQILQNMEINK